MEKRPPYKVVYIEDNASNVALIRALLEDCGDVELRTAPNAEIGIELIRAQRPDAVLMDINLPGISGFEAARRLQERPETRHIPIIALSATAIMRDAGKLKHAGFYRYLPKPLQLDEVVGALDEVLRRRESGLGT